MYRLCISELKQMHVHTRTLPKLTQPTGRILDHDYQRKCEDFCFSVFTYVWFCNHAGLEKVLPRAGPFHTAEKLSWRTKTER